MFTRLCLNFRNRLVVIDNLCGMFKIYRDYKFSDFTFLQLGLNFQGANFNFDTAECTLLSGICTTNDEMDVDKDFTYIKRIRKYLVTMPVVISNLVIFYLERGCDLYKTLSLYKFS